MNVIFTVSVAKITVHTVKCTRKHCSFSCATSNYLNVNSNYSIVSFLRVEIRIYVVHLDWLVCGHWFALLRLRWLV